MIKKITKTVLATGLFLSFTAGNTAVFASTKSDAEVKLPISLTEAAYQDEESLMEIVHNSFDEELTGLKVTNTTKSSVEMESDDYMIEAKGINLDKTGLQNVSLTLTKKAGKNPLPIELPVTAQQVSTTPETSTKTVIVDVKDVVAPTIETEESFVTDQGVSLDLASQISASDDKDETVEVSLNGDVDYNTIGSYQVEATATDKSGNTTTKIVTVNVEENFYDKIASAALAQLGVYQDCTMLVTNSLKAVGIDFHGSPAAYLSLGTVTDNPVPGDIIVYSGHVAIYIGNGQAVHGGWLGNQTVISTVECDRPFIAYVHVTK